MDELDKKKAQKSNLGVACAPSATSSIRPWIQLTGVVRLIPANMFSPENLNMKTMHRCTGQVTMF